MKRSLVLLCVAGMLFSYAQEGIKLDTLKVGVGFKRIVIFPDDIAESILGDALFFDVELPPQQGSRYSRRIVKLSYNDASKAQEDFTNYSVITQDGTMYNFVLVLSKIPELTPWIITPDRAATNINSRGVAGLRSDTIQADYMSNKSDSLKVVDAPVTYYSMKDSTVAFDTEKAKEVLPPLTKDLYVHHSLDYYRIRSHTIRFNKPRISRYFSRHGEVFIWLQGVYYDQNELYFQFKIENKASTAYDINMLKYFIATKKPVSSIEHKPVFAYKIPKHVEGKTSRHFVVVFKKFSLSRNREFKIEIDEKHGNRNISFYINHHIVNNPIRL